MNQETKNFILHVSQVQTIYEQEKEALDNVKCFAALLPMVNEMLAMCHQEFENSIAYLKEYRKERERKCIEVEEISKRIKEALQMYSIRFKKSIHEDEKEFLKTGILQCSDDELLQHLKKLMSLVQPVQHFLQHFGVTHAQIKEYERMVHDLVPAMPLNYDEIETHKKRYRHIRKSIVELSSYLEFH